MSISWLAVVVTTMNDVPPLNLQGIREKAQNRCGSSCCKKKLLLTDMTCPNCMTRFCSAHRLPEDHRCDHDYHKSGKVQLEKQLVKVVAEKLDRV
jgi:predicted nucleic acid binding AN1-type Zn finger protein